MKLKCVLTGATGCVGRNVLDELLREGWEVIALHRKTSDLSRLKGCDVQLREVDLHDPESTLAAIPESVDAIFHIAGSTSHWSAEAESQWKDNVLATRNLVDAALKRRVKRFIFTSTGATYPHQLVDEKNAFKIKNSYIRTKRLSELEVHRGIREGLDALILQPIIVFGAYDTNNYAHIFRALKSRSAREALPGRIAFCHVRDVARAHVSAFHHGRCAESYILAGPYASWKDCFELIADSVGVPRPKRVFPRMKLFAGAWFEETRARITGKKPLLTRDLIELLQDYADFSLAERRKSEEVLGYRSEDLPTIIRDYRDWLVRERLI